MAGSAGLQKHMPSCFGSVEVVASGLHSSTVQAGQSAHGHAARARCLQVDFTSTLLWYSQAWSMARNHHGSLPRSSGQSGMQSPGATGPTDA